MPNSKNPSAFKHGGYCQRISNVCPVSVQDRPLAQDGDPQGSDPAKVRTP